MIRWVAPAARSLDELLLPQREDLTATIRASEWSRRGTPRMKPIA